VSAAPTPDCQLSNLSESLLFSFTGDGITSRQPVSIAVYAGKPGSGISFLSNKASSISSQSSTCEVIIPARSDFVVNTVRNVVLGAQGVRLCFVEHLLAAAALWGADDLLIYVDGPEIPLEDGSASFWIKLFEQSELPKRLPQPAFALKESIVIAKGNKQIIANPADQFSITYLMDWQHPAIGKRWASWNAQEPIDAIASARTFGLQSEQEMLGLDDNFVSLTESGFSKPLRHEDEPVRHKLLDLLGDLSLCGVNPLSIKAQFISIRAGHELDVQMAARLQNILRPVKS